MKKIAVVFIVLMIGAVVMVSGCISSSSNTPTPKTSSGIATSNYDSDSGVTYGTTDDGYGYAYNSKGDVAVSDGYDTYVYDSSSGNVYEYE